MSHELLALEADIDYEYDNLDAAVGGDDYSLADDEVEDKSKRSNWMAGNFNMVSRPWFKRISTNSAVPMAKWQRLAFRGMASIREDGHSPFADGVLNDFVDLPRNNTLNAEIKKAIAFGFLAEGSNRRCLIAPFEVRFINSKSIRSNCDRH